MSNPPILDSVDGPITLRDLFAAAALAGMLSSGGCVVVNGKEPNDQHDWAFGAYLYADAMLAARAKEMP